MSKLNAKIGGVVHCKVKHADGSITDYGKQRNMIVNQGFSFIFTSMASQNNILFHASNFELFSSHCKYGSSNTAVTATQTDLGTTIKDTSTYLTTAGACGSTFTPATGTTVHKRTFVFSSEVGNVAVNEIGIWGYSVGNGYANLNVMTARVVLGSTINLIAGDTLMVSYSLTLVFDQYANSTRVNLTSGTYSLVGALKLINTMALLFGNIASDGTISTNNSTSGSITNGLGVNSQAQLYYMGFGTNTTFPTINTTPSPGSYVQTSAVLNRTYTTGALSCIMNLTFPVGVANTHRSIFVGGNAGADVGIQILLDANQTKASTSALNISYSVTFTRL